MSNGARRHERAMWIALVGVLATSMLWLAALLVVTVADAHGAVLTQSFVVARALGHVVMAIALRAWPGLPLFALGGWFLALALRPPVNREDEARHA